MDLTQAPRKLWEHPNPQSTAMWAFMQDANAKYGLTMHDFPSLFKWSCAHRNQFWSLFWDTQPVIHEGTYTRPVDESVGIAQLPRWFEGIRLNWAENMLWSRSVGHAPGTRTDVGKEDDKVALTEVREGNTEVRHVSWKELRRRAAAMAAAMAARGVRKGDRVVVVGAHSVGTLVVFLGTTWLGALFSSSSADMGVAGLLQRMVQIDPKFVFFDDAALYNGKVVDLREKMEGVRDGLADCPSFEKVVVMKRFQDDGPSSTDRSNTIPRTERQEDFLLPAPESATQQPPPFVRIPFQDPMVVYYSSGTTGTPKAIVHGVGPLLLNLRKEFVLHRCITPNDKILQFTTTGWIMYLVSVAQLALGGTAVLYDGSPLMPDPAVLLRLAEEQGVTILGVSPRWMTELMKKGVVPREVADLRKLRKVVSTGMVLPEQMFEWFYDVAFPAQVQLANISGGTDIAGCFVLENPLTPVYVGGCVGPALAIPIAVYDHTLSEGSRGSPLPAGTPGDLVATAAFPNVPVFLWDDDDDDDDDDDGSSRPPGRKYRAAYFDRFQDAWAQGDFCLFHPLTGGITMLGRSDGVLNPSGIRFGSSDIYAVMERCFADDVADSLCVGQRRPQDVDERVFLFLVMKPGRGLDETLTRRVKDTIARELTKRHAPRYVFEIAEIPVTVNGKKVELPVKSILSGKTVKPSGTLLNPASLQPFYKFQRVEETERAQAKL